MLPLKNILKHKLCDYVDEQNEGFFEWEELDGDLYEMILFLEMVY